MTLQSGDNCVSLTEEAMFTESLVSYTVSQPRRSRMEGTSFGDVRCDLL